MINLVWVKDHSNWEISPCVSFPSLPRYGIERRAPLAGELDAPPPITSSVLSVARNDVQRAICALKERIAALDEPEDDLDRLATYQQCLDDPAYLRWCVELWLGVPHPYAMWASPSIATLDRACSIMVVAQDEALRTDRRFAVIAPSLRGYIVKIGLGSMTRHAGQVLGLDEAIALAERAVVRERTTSRLESLLDGWSPETEIAEGVRWGDYPHWPVYIRRAPACDAPSAYDLPNWAVVKRGEIQIITPWTRDDETERASLLERQRRGDARRSIIERHAVSLIAGATPLSPSRDGRSVESATLRVPAGWVVRVFGPVSLSDTGNPLVLARVEGNKRNIWLAAEYLRNATLIAPEEE